MRKILILTITLLVLSFASKAQVDLLSAGTSSAYTVLVPGTFQLTTGLQVTFRVHTTCSASATLSVSGTTAKNITKLGGSANVAGSDILANQIVTVAYDGANWQMISAIGSIGSSGTVNSVGFAVPVEFSIAGTNPLTTSGTFTLGWQSNTQNLVLATPAAAAGQPSFRSLVPNDIPALPASKITSGILPLTLGGTGSSLAAANGGFVYSTATGMAITATGTLGQVLQSNGAAVPTWVTPSFLPTGTTGQTLHNNAGVWVADTTLYNNGTNIGIGTKTPNAKLEVVSGASPGSTTDGIVNIGANTANHLTFDGVQIQARTSAGVNRLSLNNWGGDISMVNVAGNVGIGMPVPSNKFDVQDNSTSLFAAEIAQGSGGGHGLNVYVANNGSQTVFQAASSVSGLYVLANGNVGIGKPTPSDILHVYGNTAGQYIKNENQTSGNQTGYRLTTPDRDWLLLQNLGGTPAGSLTFYDLTAGQSRLHIGITGNVGIGTTNPLQKLHIQNGRLRIDDGTSLVDIYQNGTQTMLESSNQFAIAPNGGGTAFKIDDGNANFFVPIQIQDGSQGTSKVLTSDLNGFATWQAPAFTNAAAFNASGSFTVPAGVTRLMVEVWGAGGGGGVGLASNGGGGGGGAYAKDFLIVTSGAVITVTVGNGGASGATTGGAGGAGAASTFSTITANGGTGGTTTAGGAGGTTGTALITVTGGSGYNGLNVSTTFPHGGDAGIGGTGGVFKSTSAAGSPGVAPGGGGSGAANLWSGGAGAKGRIIVWW